MNVNVAGTIDGGSTGETNGDVLDLSAHATAQLVNLGDSSASALNSGAAAGFANIEDFVGDDANDTLQGTAGDDTFTIATENDGTVADGGVDADFTNFSNVSGAAGADTFTFDASLIGTADGGAADDTFNVNVDVAGTIDGGADGANGDLLDFSAHTTSQLLDLGISSLSALNSGGANGFADVEDFTGDGANDTLQGTGNADTFSVNTTNAGSITGGVTADFTDFATLNGAAGDDRFNFTNGGSVAVVNGNDGDDRTTVDLSGGVTPAQTIMVDGGANGETNGDDLIVIGDGIAGNDEATYTPTCC